MNGAKRNASQTQDREGAPGARKCAGAAGTLAPGAKDKLSRIVGTGQLNDAPDALEEFEAVLKLNPQDEQARKFREAIRKKLQNQKK